MSGLGGSRAGGELARLEQDGGAEIVKRLTWSFLFAGN